MEIHEYRKRVKALAALRNGGAIFNGSADHAAVIVENLFAVANHHVRILSGDLDARVYGNSRVVQRAAEFLGHSDHRLDIMLEENTLSAHHPLMQIVGNNPNVSLRLIRADVAEGIPYHFMIADEDCYRFEEQKGTHKAVAAFGDPNAMNLSSIHEKILPYTSQISLAELH
jgi:hypothetical protein